MKKLDELADRAVRDWAALPPSFEALRARARQRHRRRYLLGWAAAVVALVVASGLVYAAFAPSGSVVEAVAPNESESTSPVLSSQPVNTTSSIDNDTVEGEPTVSQSMCGPWPTSLELLARLEHGPIEATSDSDGRSRQRLSADGYTVEVIWPPNPRVEYDLDAGPALQMTGSAESDGHVVRLVIDPDGQSQADDTPPAPDSGLEVMRLAVDDPIVAGLYGACENFEFRIYEGDQLIEHHGIGLGSLDEEHIFTDEESGSELTLPGSPKYVELGPIVTSQQAVASVPGSGTCDGVLVDVDTTAYRIDDAVSEPATLAAAIETGHFVPIDDPAEASKDLEQLEFWAVLLPGASADATLDDLRQDGTLSYIDAAIYESYVDPDLGPTAGPGIEGVYQRPIDALKAFFELPEAQTFITSSLVELTIDNSTKAYGVPEGHGGDGYITVITVERETGGWAVTGWTGAGC